MFNPLYPFSEALLESFVKSGKVYFVRNSFPRGFDHFEDNIKAYLLITHYDDKSKALAHYNSISHDRYRFLYELDNPEHLHKLTLAAKQPEGYKIYSTLFVPDWKKRITKELNRKVNNYMKLHTKWKPEKGESVNLDFYFQFGQLYFTLVYNGDKIMGNFEDIEKA